MNKVKVSICGKEYTIQTSEPASSLYSLARVLENKINDFTDHSSASQFTASVLVGLSCLDDLKKANDRIDLILEESKKYVDEAGKSRLERDAAIKENEELKTKIDQLEKELSVLKEQTQSA